MLQHLDNQLLKRIYQLPFKRTLFIRALIFAGDGPAWMLVVLTLAITAFLLNDLTLFLSANLLIVGLIIGNLVFVPFKKKVNRRRPYANPQLQQKLGIEIVNRDPDHGSKAFESFPSGHALWTTICVSLLCSQLGTPALIFLAWLIPAMMFLRPYLGVHYPSDALVGFLIGVGISWLVLTVHGQLMELSASILTGGMLHLLGYWVFLALFLFAGFKSWLKRV